jgi:cytosine/adenosine deaminase-related metal-dependent hydrolase
MASEGIATTHVARRIVPVEGPPIDGGCVVVRGDRIAAVGPRRIAEGTVVDHGEATLLPGLVNAHTHLEFSRLTTPLGAQGIAFHDWVHLVIAHRMSADFDAAAAVALGLRQSLAAGVTTIGDITTVDPFAFFVDPPSAGCVVSFYELIGVAPDLARLDEFLALSDGPTIRRGISPHAPYSLSPDVVTTAAARSAARRVPLTFHLAETREELQLLRDGTGPLVDSLRVLGFWADGAIPKAMRPLDYLRMLEPAHRSLLAHGNYFTAEEIAFLAAHAERMTVVYCPRTHAFFAHDPHPLPKLLAAGARVAVGTDGRCSNPDLNLLDDLRLIARTQPQLSPARIVRLGTLDGARALGLDDEIGSLTVGKRADLVALATPSAIADPHEAILAPESHVAAVVFRGKPCIP